MRERLLKLIASLREAGLPISPAETLDAMEAVRVGGVEPTALREALAATLVKYEEDRAAFERAFAAAFAAPPPSGRARGRTAPRSGGGDAAASAGGAGSGSAARAGAERRRQEHEPPHEGVPRPGEAREDRSDREQRSTPAATRPKTPPPSPESPSGERKPQRPSATPREERNRRLDLVRETARSAGGRDRPTAMRAVRASALLDRDLRAMEPEEVAAAHDAAAEIGRRFRARASRRERRLRRGRIDVRRTIRASVSRGGSLIDLARRGRRPGRPHLLALCDVSGSVAHTSDLLLAILAGAAGAFGRVQRYAYVDRPVPIDFENGQIRPAGMLDMHALSDMGAVLCDLEADPQARIDRSTVLLVLGDARNNRRPARADALKRLAQRARAVVWAVPEPRARWGTGDSALDAYAPVCDLVLEATSLAGLAAAVRGAARG